MSEFFDKLRVDRKLEESLRLCNEIHNPDLRDRLRTLIALNFSDVNPEDELLASILGVDLVKQIPPDISELQRRSAVGRGGAEPSHGSALGPTPNSPENRSD